MLEETAIITRRQGQFAWVSMQRQSTCGSCQASKGCGTSVLSKVIGNRFTTVKALNVIDADEGDKVLVGIEESSLIRAAFAVNFIPLLGLILGAIFFNALSQQLATDGEWLSLAGGVLGFITGILWVRQYSKSVSTDKRYQPVVLKKLLQ